MKRKERFVLTLQGEIPDRVPIFDFLSSKKLVEHFTGTLPDSYNVQDIMAVTKGMDFDAAVIPFGGFANEDVKTDDNPRGYDLKDNRYIDEWGVVFENNDASWPGDAPVIHPVADREDFEKYFKVPDPWGDFRLDDLNKAIALNSAYDCALVGVINGPFTIALMQMGLENMSYALYEDETLIPDIMNAANSFLTVATKRMINAGADAVILAEDLAHSGGSFFHPQVMKKLVFPELQKTVNSILDAGSIALLHTCGDVTEIFEDIVALGVHGVNPIQASAGMDIELIKRLYGDRVTLMGNLDSSNLLPYGTCEQIRNEVKRLMTSVAKNGRYIFCSDSDIRDDMPLENVFAMFEEAKLHSQY